MTASAATTPNIVTRMKKTPLALLLVIIAVLAGCATPRRPAPVVDMATPVNSVRVPDGPGFYTVKKGDVLNRIAQEFGQNIRDIVIWNNLTNPNDIQVDQVLRVLPPAGTAQTASVSAGSGVDVRPLNSGGAGPAKTGPRGDKLPYSEAALAQLQKPDGAPPAVAPPARIEAPKAVSKPIDTSPPEEENVGFIWLTEGRVTTPFDAGKKGIDIAGKSGQPVLASGAGKVMYAGSGIRGYGNLVIVKHTPNLLSAYGHNKTILVKEGQMVARGEKIAEMGNSDSDSVKLHFEIRQQSKPVDPAKFLPSR